MFLEDMLGLGATKNSSLPAATQPCMRVALQHYINVLNMLYRLYQQQSWRGKVGNLCSLKAPKALEMRASGLACLTNGGSPCIK